MGKEDSDLFVIQRATECSVIWGLEAYREYKSYVRHEVLAISAARKKYGSSK